MIQIEDWANAYGDGELLEIGKRRWVGGLDQLIMDFQFKNTFVNMCKQWEDDYLYFVLKRGIFSEEINLLLRKKKWVKNWNFQWEIWVEKFYKKSTYALLNREANLFAFLWKADL